MASFIVGLLTLAARLLKFRKEKEGWSNAHEDILLLVKRKLNLVDQIRFGLVCSGWNSLPYISHVDGNLPWILGMQQDLERGFRITGFYNPSTNKKYLLDYQVIKPLDCHGFHEPNVYASKHGWLFLYVLPIGGGECKFILLHAFTMKTINLPTLDFGLFDELELDNDNVSEYWGSMGTFSTVPTRSDCVFYCIRYKFKASTGDDIIVSTYSHGDETWKTIRVSNPQHMLCDIIYMNNLLYCIFSHGEMWAFDVMGEEWDEIIEEDNAVGRFGNLHLCKFLEYDGELLLASFWPVPRQGYYYIHRVDWIRKKWVEEVEFRNLALFIGDNTSHLVSIASDEENEKIKSSGDYHISRHIDCGGHISPFVYLWYGSECHFLSKWFQYRIWVEPSLARLPP